MIRLVHAELVTDHNLSLDDARARALLVALTGLLELTGAPSTASGGLRWPRREVSGY